MFVLPPKPSHLQSLSQQHSHQPNVIDHSLNACDEATSDENDNHAEKLNSNVIENSINYIVLDLNQSTSPQSPTTIINTSSSSAQGMNNNIFTILIHSLKQGPPPTFQLILIKQMLSSNQPTSGEWSGGR